MILGIPKRILIVLVAVAGIGYVYLNGASERTSEGAEGGGAGPTGCRMVVTADVLNVRAEPGTHADIVGKFKENAETDAELVERDGFRKLAENRWASTEFLKPVGGADCG
ncbi:SH3 domain-containing protein [Amycolatopsis palatopharyngis]|uniref:SH3 domain-containing protein n=1 Tax=Amycolatopsis palatopharyngis TaxID=187982 RepID=UPI000E24D52A|nr:SH3 domain-containing protein [Amycolatopsis palatopharyngis]